MAWAFEARDLFDHVERGEGEASVAGRRVSRLAVGLEEREEEEFFTVWDWEDAYMVRYELGVELVAETGEVVLSGHVSGVAVDTVSDLGVFDRTRREDVRLAAQQDAAMKVSRALREAAGSRGAVALARVEPVVRPEGAGPVVVAVLGFDDAESSRLRRGQALSGRLVRGLDRMAPGMDVIEERVVRRALEGVEGNRYMELGGKGVQQVAPGVARATWFVAGRVERGGGRLTAEMVVWDRGGEEVGRARVVTEGLGALEVCAARLVGELAALAREGEAEEEPNGGS